MLNLISCELLKLKRSKMVLISVAGVLSTPLLMLIEALQTHFDKPEIIFTLSDIYSEDVYKRQAYARRKDKDLRTLVRYAKLFRVEKILRQYLEVLL